MRSNSTASTSNFSGPANRILHMSQQNKHSELAAQIRAAYAGTPIAAIRPQLADLDVDAAYAIQQENTAHWEAEGRRLVGSKIGLTSRAVQKQLGVDRPDFGVLFADMIVAEDEPVAAGRVLQPKIEAEVAFLLDRDVDVEAPTVADVLLAVAYMQCRHSKSSAAVSPIGTLASSTQSPTTLRRGSSSWVVPSAAWTGWSFARC